MIDNTTKQDSTVLHEETKGKREKGERRGKGKRKEGKEGGSDRTIVPDLLERKKKIGKIEWGEHYSNPRLKCYWCKLCFDR